MAFFFLLDRLLFYYAHRIYPPPDILPHFGMRLVHEIVVCICIVFRKMEGAEGYWRNGIITGV